MKRTFIVIVISIVFSALVFGNTVNPGNTGTNSGPGGGKDTGAGGTENAGGTGAGAGISAETPLKLEQEMPLNDSYSFLKSLMALCFVLGLIFLATYVFKKLTGLKTHGFGGLGRGRLPIHPVSSLPLGDKKFLSIVEIQGRHYFLGITQNSINLLAELPYDQQANPVAAEDNKNPGQEGRDMDFSTILHRAKQLLNRTKK